MENETKLVVVKKNSKGWKIVTIVLAVVAVAVAAFAVYRKFFKKKNAELMEDDQADLLDESTDAIEIEEEAPFEVAAEAVIANAEEMDDTLNAADTTEEA